MSGYGAANLDIQCGARCLGIAGHRGPHQTVDGRPLLFDTPEDRERLIAALCRWWEAEAPDNGQNDAEADAIIAALRGEQ